MHLLFYLLKTVAQFSFFKTLQTQFLLIKKYVVQTNLELHKSITLHGEREQIIPLICIMDKI